MASFWADENFDFEDSLNASIWNESPARGARLAQLHGHANAGGWQDRWANPALPWVPDLVGHRWREEGGVVVIGSAYAPFVDETASRHASMPLREYANAKTASEFGPRFLAHVIRPDASYYGKLRILLEGLVEPERLVLTDLCRASFVEASRNGFAGGDEVVGCFRHEFDAWVAWGGDWTLSRIQSSGARVVVMLGEIAWASFGDVVRRGDGVFEENRPQLSTPACWFVLAGTRRLAIRVSHPAWQNRWDPGYAAGRGVLSTLLGVAPPGPGAQLPATPPSSTAKQGRPRRQARGVATPTAGARVIGLHFICRRDLNVTLLPDGTFETGVWVVAEKHANTAEYVALHESKTRGSYRQGRILSVRSVEYEGRLRRIFHVQPESKSLAWVGDGAGERGYLWS